MTDILTLTLPAKAKYVLPLRLYISGVATRMNYEVNDMEDVKTAVSEACVLLLSEIEDGDLRVVIETGEKLLEVDLTLERYEKKVDIPEENTENRELSRMILEAMADGCEVREQDGINVQFRLRFDK